MARQSRKKSESGIYHIIFRGINKQNIFEDDEDRRKFLETLKYYKELCNYLLYGYCLMDNHIHFLIKERNETISQLVKRISASYVHWYRWDMGMGHGWDMGMGYFVPTERIFLRSNKHTVELKNVNFKRII